MDSKKLYNSSKFINAFENEKELQPPEMEVVRLLGDELKNYSMLDLGVGGGGQQMFLPN